MSQMTWTYFPDRGGSHRIGLFHGDVDRHLLIYCDDQILIIDFHVRSTRRYSFFIDDEWLEIIVEETNGGFAYGLVPNRRADTPGNRDRRRAERREYVRLALLALLVAGVISAAIFFVLRANG